VLSKIKLSKQGEDSLADTVRNKNESRGGRNLVYDAKSSRQNGIKHQIWSHPNRILFSMQPGRLNSPAGCIHVKFAGVPDMINSSLESFSRIAAFTY